MNIIILLSVIIFFIATIALYEEYKLRKKLELLNNLTKEIEAVILLTQVYAIKQRLDILQLKTEMIGTVIDYLETALEEKKQQHK